MVRNRQTARFQTMSIGVADDGVDTADYSEKTTKVSVTLNGVKVQPEPVDTPKPTGGTLKGPEAATGPLMIQGNHGPVAMRNIRVKAMDIKE